MRTILSIGLVLSTLGVAVAEPRIAVTPKLASPGDPVVVTVVGTTDLPKGTAGATPLEFFAVKGGFRAVFAIPLDASAEPITVEVDSAKLPAKVGVRTKVFRETDVNVADEFATPGARDRTKIAADNAAIIGAALKSKGAPQFTLAFRRPLGIVTSTFGEWRRWNEDESGHRSQHLGLDIGAKAGTRVTAANAGTVTLVRDCFLAGKVIVISHGAGISTAYYHLSKITVAEGETVTLGEEIGEVGDTGRTTGPHVHISVRVPGGFVDPASFFKLVLAPTPAATARR
jgi:murein DD-endopeptidase MepM/ murein hydrolase activator NlpD